MADKKKKVLKSNKENVKPPKKVIEITKGDIKKLQKISNTNDSENNKKAIKNNKNTKKITKKIQKRFSKQLKRNIKEFLTSSPLLEGLVDELEKIETIRDDLYAAYINGDLIEEYTNKSGATNTVVNPAIKEYKSYSQRFNDLTKTIHSIIKDIAPEIKTDELDPFEKLLRRGKGD